MPLYRNRQRSEAVQWHKPGDHPAVQAAPGRPDGFDAHTYPELPAGHGWCPMPDGVGGAEVEPGDWIVAAADGGFVVVKARHFPQVFELAE